MKIFNDIKTNFGTFSWMCALVGERVNKDLCRKRLAFCVKMKLHPEPVPARIPLGADL